MTAKQLGAEMSAKQAALNAIFEKHKTDGGYDMPAEVVEDVRSRNEELAALGKSYDAAVEVEQIAAKSAERLRELNAVEAPIVVNAKGGDSRESYESLGTMFVKRFYDRDRSGRVVNADSVKTASNFGRDIELSKFDLGVELKTTMTTAAGFAPENLRSGRLQPFAVRALQLFDVFPTIQVGVNNGAYVYMEETTFTNNAAEISENDGTGAPEGALAWTERSVTIRNIPTFIPVTDEQLADVAGIESYLNSRLTYMVRARLESQLIAGDGNAPNVSGLVTQISQSQALGADPVFDCVMKGITKCRATGFANPDAILLHPNDWQSIRLTRTTDGQYLMGSPDVVGAERLFGLPVVVSTALTENTGYVGDFTGHSSVVYRKGVEVKVSDSHSDYFIKFKQAVRANVRAALVIFRASAFCKLTGI
jgi:HK97 family phage major capsid protein